MKSYAWLCISLTGIPNLSLRQHYSIWASANLISKIYISQGDEYESHVSLAYETEKPGR
jgi:hypothetical protein